MKEPLTFILFFAIFAAMAVSLHYIDYLAHQPLPAPQVECVCPPPTVTPKTDSSIGGDIAFYPQDGVCSFP
jgi:hypothetical protein